MNQNYTLKKSLGLLILVGLFSCTKNSEWMPLEIKRDLSKKTGFPETKPLEDTYRDGTLPPLYHFNYDISKIPKPKPDPDPEPWKDIPGN